MIQRKYTLITEKYLTEENNIVNVGDRQHRPMVCRNIVGYYFADSKACFYIPELYKGIKNAYDLLVDCYGKDIVKEIEPRKNVLKSITVLGPGFQSIDDMKYTAEHSPQFLSDVSGALDEDLTVFSDKGKIFACTIDDIYSNNYTSKHSAPNNIRESSFSDYELYQILEENGYKTTNKNLQILKEGLFNKKYKITKNNIEESEYRNINICGRAFKLPVHYNLYSGETLLDGDKKNLETFVSKLPSFASAIKQRLVSYIQRDIKGQKSDSTAEFSDFKFEKDEDVFKFIKPSYIYVPRASNKVMVMCNYRFDPGHGIGISVDLKNNAVSINSQDELL